MKCARNAAASTSEIEHTFARVDVTTGFREGVRKNVESLPTAFDEVWRIQAKDSHLQRLRWRRHKLMFTPEDVLQLFHLNLEVGCARDARTYARPEKTAYAVRDDASNGFAYSCCHTSLNYGVRLLEDEIPCAANFLFE
jgi:hypothetical protein